MLLGLWLMLGVCSLSVLVLHVLTYSSEEERSKIRVVQTDNVRGLLGTRRMDKVPNARIRKLWGRTKGVDERIDGVLRWFGHVEKIENYRIAKRVYAGVSS